MSSFGEKILKKFGYVEGEGLGKDRTGITAPIKTKFKFDQKGLGEGSSEKQSSQWWERVFNEAASNFDVNTNVNDGSVNVNVVDESGVEITNKSYSMKKLKSKNKTLAYGKFMQSSTLLENSERKNEDSVEMEDIEIQPTQSTLTDDELFKICGGRTAHKMARHGLKLSGKLKRVEEQEAQMIEKMKKSSKKEKYLNEGMSNQEVITKKESKKSKRKREKRKIIDEPDDDNEIWTSSDKRMKLNESFESTDHEEKIEKINRMAVEMRNEEKTIKRKKKSKRKTEKKETRKILNSLDKKLHL